MLEKPSLFRNMLLFYHFARSVVYGYSGMFLCVKRREGESIFVLVSD